MSNRVDDIRRLNEVQGYDDVREADKEVFADMLHRLENGQHELTDKQRDWLKSALDEPGYVNMVSSGRASKIVRHGHKELAECTASCPAWSPPSLRNLPLKPPGRR
jgi:hypothetical protein